MNNTILKDKVEISSNIDENFGKKYLEFLKNLNLIYSKDTTKVNRNVFIEIRDFVKEHVSNRVREKSIPLYRVYVSMVDVQEYILNNNVEKRYLYKVSSNEEAENDKSDNKEVLSYQTFLSVLDVLPLPNHIRLGLKQKFTEPELKAIINTFRQKNPSANDNDLAIYLKNTVYPNKGFESIIEVLNFSSSEKKMIKSFMTERELINIIYEFKQKNSSFKETELKQTILFEIKKKINNIKSGKNPIIDSLNLSAQDKYILSKKLSIKETEEILTRYRRNTKKRKLSQDEINLIFNKILDNYIEKSIEFILSIVGTVEFTKRMRESVKVDMHIDKIGQVSIKRSDLPLTKIDPTEVFEEPADGVRIKKPEDLYKGLKDFTDRGRIFFRVPEFQAWYFNPETANYIAFKIRKIKPFYSHDFLPKMLLPTVYQVVMKHPDDQIIISPHKLYYILNKFDANFVRNNIKDKTIQRMIKVEAQKLHRLLKSGGIYKAIVHHSNPRNMIVPTNMQPADPSKARLIHNTDQPALNCLKLLDSLIKI